MKRSLKRRGFDYGSSSRAEAPSALLTLRGAKPPAGGGAVVGRARPRPARHARKSFDDAFRLMRSLTGVRPPVEALRLQTDYARTSFQNMMAFTKAMSEAQTRMANEVTSAAAAP